MGTAKRLPFPLGKQPGQLTKELDGKAVISIAQRLAVLLLQIEKAGERNAPLPTALPDGRLGRVALLQLDQAQKILPFTGQITANHHSHGLHPIPPYSAFFNIIRRRNYKVNLSRAIFDG